MSSGDSPSPAELTFPGDGEMARRMRAFPWPDSPLGDPRDWPASLRTACRICLTSRFPMIVWWGKELRFLYNDAYLPLLGSKHPALGRPGDQVWGEYLQRLLRPGYEVTTVTDGQAALEAARADPPDILISDVMMPRLGGLQLVAALRADLRTADVPVLLLSARAGQEAAIEGLEAGADDYLVKPFSAAELLARVRANVELARVRSHHARWRAALLDSLYEAFFLCDETGAVVEVNAAFADLLGFGPQGLPYPPAWPWWPGENTDPEAHRLVGEAFGRLMTDGKGSFTVPLTRRDGRRIWVAGSFNEVSDPDNGRRMVVGTFRDVTAEHYAVQREAALAAMGLVLSRAGSAVQVLHETLGELLRGALMNQVTIEPGPAGTTVDMYLRITHGYPA